MSAGNPDRFESIGYGAMILQIAQVSVLTCDCAPAIVWLDTLLANRERVLGHVGGVSLVFDGYDEDQRELYEIAQVRDYARSLARRWPYWTVFAERSSTFPLLTSLACDGGVIANSSGQRGFALSNPTQVGAFLSAQFDGQNALFARLGIAQEINARVSAEVLRMVERLFGG
jgi:hypothetical protein